MTIRRANMRQQIERPPMKKPTKKFKPCAGCPNPAKCRAMGKCMKKAKSRK